jgi:hypothetical protein
MEEQVRVKMLEEPSTVGARDEHAYLLGTPPVREFMQFIRMRALSGGSSETALIERWRIAADYRRELETIGGDIPNSETLKPLSEEMQDAADRLRQELGIDCAMSGIPYRYALVDLDQVIVHQRSVNLAYVEALRTTLPQNPSDQELLRFTSGQLMPAAEVHVTRAAENVFTFSSDSSDLRHLDTALLHPATIPWHQPTGRPTHILAVSVGFGINFLSALYTRGKLILINGTHRAYLLYELGIRTVPCLVHEVSCDDDFNLSGAADIQRSLQVYLRSKHPPRLRDFFDPHLCHIIPVSRANQLVHIQVNTQRSRICIA